MPEVPEFMLLYTGRRRRTQPDTSAFVQNFPHDLQQGFRREGLLQEALRRLHESATDDVVIRVARHIERFHRWANPGQALDETPTIQAGHYDVGKNKIDLSCLLRRDVHCLESVLSGKNPVTLLLQNPRRE